VKVLIKLLAGILPALRDETAAAIFLAMFGCHVNVGADQVIVARVRVNPALRPDLCRRY
jgi:hypothetical protein